MVQKEKDILQFQVCKYFSAVSIFDRIFTNFDHYEAVSYVKSKYTIKTGKYHLPHAHVAVF